MPAHKLPYKNFMWTPQLAYAVGLLTTDGNLSKDERYITLRSSDIQLLQTFAESLHLSNRITENSSGGYTKKASYRIQFGNVQLYQWLLKVGLTPAKTYTIGALKIPNRYFQDFLRGHLDGDGSITIYRDYCNVRKNPKYIYDRIWLRFISASKVHILWLRSRIAKLTGLEGHMWTDQQQTKPNSVSMHVIKFGKNDSIKLLKWMYYNPNVPCLKRKREKAKKFLC